MLYTGCDSLFDQSFKYGIFRIPFWKIFYRSVYENRRQFVDRFSSLKLNNGESKLLFRSDAYEHLFTEYDIAALQSSILWAAVANTAPLCCWSVVDLLLHSDAFEAVKQFVEY